MGKRRISGRGGLGGLVKTDMGERRSCQAHCRHLTFVNSLGPPPSVPWLPGGCSKCVHGGCMIPHLLMNQSPLPIMLPKQAEIFQNIPERRDNVEMGLPE